MADYSVSTAQELMSAISNCLGGTLDDTITLTADIDFNNSPYYNWNSDFINLYTEISYRGKVVTIDGNNHVLSNIYCKSGKNILYLGVNSGTINIKNLTIEAITTNAKIIYPTYTTNFENVTFNVKAYNEDNGLFILSPLFPNTFTNCIFNIYITNTKNTNITMFRSTGSSRYQARHYFYSCIFKIRNATSSYFYMFDTMTLDGYVDAAYLENCAIFYNDVGVNTPDYSTTSNQLSLSDRLNLINTYIASFGTVTKKPRIEIHDNTTFSTVQSCFVDSDKISARINNADITPSSGTVNGVTALTTAQCKDRNKLSEIGYIFAEET